MILLRRAGAALVILISQAGRVGIAQEGNSLTFEEALARARERGPAVLAARARVEEARGRLKGATIRMRGNPVLDGGLGRRTVAGEEFTELEVGLTQGLSTAGQRSARIAGAEAGVSSEIANSEEVTRRHALEVGETFFRVVHATERLRLLRNSQDVAAEIARIAERRFQAGDVAVLDVNVAGAARARARSEVLSGEADLRTALGELKVLLDVKAEGPLAVRGALDRLPAYDLSVLVERAAKRPDIDALTARIQQAEAEARVGSSFRRPEFDVGVRYKEEENAKAVLGGLIVSLPVFDRGQGTSAEASARALRLRMELDALRQAAETEVRTAFDTYVQRLEASSVLLMVLPSLTESEELAGRSYEVGQIRLADLLLIRRDVVETRLSYLDRAFEAVVAGIRLEASAGVLR